MDQEGYWVTLLKKWERKKYALRICYHFLLLFDVPFENISLVKKRHHCHWRTTEPMTFELWGIYSATTAVNWDFGCCGLIQRTVSIGRFLWQAGGLENHSKPFFSFHIPCFSPDIRLDNLEQLINIQTGHTVIETLLWLNYSQKNFHQKAHNNNKVLNFFFTFKIKSYKSLKTNIKKTPSKQRQ